MALLQHARNNQATHISFHENRDGGVLAMMWKPNPKGEIDVTAKECVANAMVVAKSLRHEVQAPLETTLSLSAFEMLSD